jgi:hypothetical protein
MLAELSPAEPSLAALAQTSVSRTAAAGSSTIAQARGSEVAPATSVEAPETFGVGSHPSLDKLEEGPSLQPSSNLRIGRCSAFGTGRCTQCLSSGTSVSPNSYAAGPQRERTLRSPCSGGVAGYSGYCPSDSLRLARQLLTI